MRHMSIIAVMLTVVRAVRMHAPVNLVNPVRGVRAVRMHAPVNPVSLRGARPVSGHIDGFKQDNARRKRWYSWHTQTEH